jgi:hypothetical protein
MKGDSSIAPKAMPTHAKREKSIAPSDLGQKQRLFADALNKAAAKPALQRNKQAEDQPVGALVTAPINYAATAMAPTPATAATDAAFAAHIERIAAAIAEVAAGGAKADFHLTLPVGPTRIDGAVIGRDALGQLHIVLTTASAIAPATAAQLQSQLTERLLRREIRVAKMGLQRMSRRDSEA